MQLRPADCTICLRKTEVSDSIFGVTWEFETLNDLKYQLSNYVNWFNNHRIHSSLGYLTPYQYKNNTLKKIV